MEIVKGPPDEIDDRAGSPSGVETADSDVGKYHDTGGFAVRAYRPIGSRIKCGSATRYRQN